MSELTDSQLLAFGKIIHRYAEIEWGVRCILAGIVETPLLEALILTEPYSAANLKNVVQSAAKQSNLESKHQEEVVQIVGDWSAFAKLRNAIAHRKWERGSRKDAIRPIGVDIRSGKAKMVGDVDDRDWIESELFEAADKLGSLNERAKKFYYDSGLAEATTARNKAREATAQAKRAEHGRAA